jgi:integrase
MIRLGRPRENSKDLPLGVYPVKGRYYVRPVNREMRAVFAVKFPGKTSAPLGADKTEARKLWIKLFVQAPELEAAPGMVAEIVARYERDVLPHLHRKTKAEHTRYCKTLTKEFGHWRYAKSEAEAVTGPFLRSMHITQYLRREEKREVRNKHGTLISTGRAVASNKEIQCFSRMFKLAKTEWGYTEYNPCLQVEYNHEEPRGMYASDETFMLVYAKALPALQCMMDLAQMHGARRGMLLRLSLSDLNDDGVWVTLNKRKKTETVRRQVWRYLDDQGKDTGLREVVARILELRAKIRGGKKQQNVEDLANAPLFLNRFGKRMTESGFNSLWQRARVAAGFKRHEFHFHDIKAKSVSDSPDEINAMNRGGHIELRTTRKVYRRKPTEIIALPRVSKK